MLETGLYAGLLALLYVYLAIRVIKIRVTTKTKLGDGGHAALVNSIRAHGNFSEYVPLALVLLGILNYQELPVAVIHTFGTLLVLGRLIHAYSISKDILKLRPVGMGMTFTVITVSAVLLIVRYFSI